MKPLAEWALAAPIIRRASAGLAAYNHRLGSRHSQFAWHARIAAIAAIGVTTLCGASLATAANCKLARIAEWPVRVENGHILVDGAINGQKIAIMLDTGAANTLLFRPAAERLGLAPRPTKARMFGVGGEATVEVAEVGEFRIGDAVRTKWLLPVIGTRFFGADMILGEQFFQLVDLEFDLAHDAVRLFQAEDCGGVSLAYWAKEGIGVVEMSPLSAGEPQIVVPVKVNGEPLQALFDSGASASFLDKGEAARLGATPDSPGVVPAGRVRGGGRLEFDSWIANFNTFTIGNETIRDVALRFSDFRRDAWYTQTGSHVPTKVMASFSMLLGVDFIRAHRVMVAHSQRKLYFTHTGGPVFETARTPSLQDKSRADERATPPLGAR
jgi:hypothetical protein